VRRFLVLVPLLAFAVGASAQSDPTLMTKAGYWKPAGRNLPAGEPADGPSLEPFAANLDGVLAVLRRTPVLAQPHGFVAVPLIDRELGRPRAPFLGLVRVTVLFFHHDDGGSVVPEDAGPQIDVAINDPSCVWQSHEVAFVDSAGSLYYDAPQDSSAVRGIPGYSPDSGCLVMARRGVPLFTAVSRERFLRDARDTLLARVHGVSLAALDSADPRVMYQKWLADAAGRKRQRDSLAAGLAALSADARKQALAAYDNAQGTMGAALKEQARTADSGGGFAAMRRAQQGALDTVRALAMHYDAELKALPAGERRAPAWVKTSDAGVQDLAAPGAPDARQLVAPNPALFDAALPRSAIQMLTIQAVASNGDDSAAGLLSRIRGELDYAALGRLLK
jgi:hypothetical protein